MEEYGNRLGGRERELEVKEISLLRWERGETHSNEEKAL
jgi:hypothetical protein